MVLKSWQRQNAIEKVLSLQGSIKAAATFINSSSIIQSMSDSLLDIIPAEPRENLGGLQACISKLEDHLKCTNEKLGKFRQLIRTEPNIKSRNIYLSKVYAMVKEQHTIQSILESYKTKLKGLETQTKQKSCAMQSHQQTKNTKLFELFHNYEPMETRFEKKPIKTSETVTVNGKKRKVVNDDLVAVEDVTPNQICIDNHGKAMKCLKALVKKRICVEEQKQADAKEEQKHDNVKEDQKHDDAKVEQKQDDANDQTEAELQPVLVQDQLKEELKLVPVADTIPDQIAVNNLGEALQYLKALQEYAMLNENFRAIGLLTEAEKVFISPPSDTDFEL